MEGEIILHDFGWLGGGVRDGTHNVHRETDRIKKKSLMRKEAKSSKASVKITPRNNTPTTFTYSLLPSERADKWYKRLRFQYRLWNVRVDVNYRYRL